MRKTVQTGFSVVELLLILIAVSIVIGAGFFVWGKQNNKSVYENDHAQENTQNSDDKTEAEPKIFNLGISSMEDMDITSNATRDFEKNGHKGFYIFGDELPGTPIRHNPNFEFASVKEGVELISAINGIVGFVEEQQESGDYEVFLMSEENSPWVISYDHVSELKVKKGDKVKVGDVLGYPARQNNGLLRYEFQINKDDGSKDGIHVCPVNLLDSSVKQTWIDGLSKSQNEWEEVTKLELYNQSNQDPAGCLYKEMTPGFAQGTE